MWEISSKLPKRRYDLDSHGLAVERAIEGVDGNMVPDKLCVPLS